MRREIAIPVEKQSVSDVAELQGWKIHPAYLSYSIKEWQRQLLIEYICAVLCCAVQPATGTHKNGVFII